MAVIDEPKDQPIGGINIPLYEVTPGKQTRIRKLLNEPEKVSFIISIIATCMCTCDPSCMSQVLKRNVLEKTELGKIELNFQYDPHSSILKVGINQAVPHSKSQPNPYVTGYEYS